MREKLLMNRDWRFYFGEPEYKQPLKTSFDQTYRGSRGENARGPARRDFYDNDWRVVNLPHDFVNENGPSQDLYDTEKHKYPQNRGAGWYRKYFKLDEADKGKRITLLFDGVSTRCEVYVNSMILKLNRTAGIGFEVDITELARYGTDYNVVAVHADATDYEAWYYEGGGIYRNVWLVKTDRLAVDLWGTFVHTNRLDDKNWKVNVETEIRNDYFVDKKAVVKSRIADPEGKIVAELTSEELNCKLQKVTTFYQDVVLEDPMLWGTGADGKNLYKLYTEVLMDGAVIDTYETTFGIRELVFDKDKGLFVNGKKTVIYGFANHQIQVGMGNAMSDSMREYHMRTIADIGGNGFRTAHSPHGEATYDYCDKYGILVMDENRVFHPSEMVQDEVKRLVKRDRNHPSVCMWSLYNEEDSVTDHTGKFIMQKLAAVAKEYDPTRPTTGATSYGMYTEGAHEKEYGYDLFGVNHQAPYFEGLHKEKPDLPLYCSESVMPLGKQRMGSELYYEGNDAHIFFEKEFVIGGFHFTAWAHDSDRPRIMACDGTYTPKAHGYKAFLKQNEPYAKIPTWNYPGQEGKVITCEFPNNGEYIEIYVNDKFVKKVETDMYAITPTELVYEPGKIQMIAYKDGKVWAEDTMYTAGKPAAIKLVMENLSLKADNDDVAIINAFLVDEKGNWCDATTGWPVTFSCNGVGEYIGSTTQRLDAHVQWHGPTMNFVFGKATAYFRSMAQDGNLVITAEVKGLPKAELVIEREMTGAIPAVETVPNNFVIDWQISPLMPGSIDAQLIMEQRDIEIWKHIDTQGSPDVLFGARDIYPADVDLNYAYYTKTVVPDMGEKPAGKKLFLNFEGLDGISDVYIVGKDGKTMTAHHPSNSPWDGHYRPQWYVDADEFEAGEEVEIWVFIYAASRVTGIGWPVHWDYVSQEFVDEWVEREKREWDYHNYKAFVKG
ncbi:MAG: hypothetical protein J6D00_04055 [Christensenellaceae bacterium]|nr:hypothetical protein [Christensenellaceae bacterium]